MTVTTYFEREYFHRPYGSHGQGSVCSEQDRVGHVHFGIEKSIWACDREKYIRRQVKYIKTKRSIETVRR